MQTMKKFWIYFLIFIICFGLVSILTSILMNENYKNISDYVIKTDSPKIEVTEFKSTYSHGYINVNVTNNTGEHIPLKYLKIDLYNNDGIYLLTKYEELKYFNVNETIKIEFNFDDTNVSKAVLEIIDEIPNNINESEESVVGDVTIQQTITNKTVEFAAPIAGILVLLTLIP